MHTLRGPLLLGSACDSPHQNAVCFCVTAAELLTIVGIAHSWRLTDPVNAQPIAHTEEESSGSSPRSSATTPGARLQRLSPCSPGAILPVAPFFWMKGNWASQPTDSR